MERIDDPRYWRERLMESCAHNWPLYHSIFRGCSPERWADIAVKHASILAKHVKPNTYILDIGCGWGRLLELLPEHWKGRYFGVDISPDFISLAKRLHPTRCFDVADFAHVRVPQADLGVAISFIHMVKRHSTPERYAAIQENIKASAKHILYLEYDITDEGTLV